MSQADIKTIRYTTQKPERVSPGKELRAITDELEGIYELMNKISTESEVTTTAPIAWLAQKLKSQLSKLGREPLAGRKNA